MLLFDARGEISRADKHVESCGDVLSDAGSTPAASTIRLTWRSATGEPSGSLMAGQSRENALSEPLDYARGESKGERESKGLCPA